MKQNELIKQAAKHGTPLLLIDHDVIRENYRKLREYLPRVGLYFAVKANPELQIVRTLYPLDSGFDVASLQEFEAVMANIPPKDLRGKKLGKFI